MHSTWRGGRELSQHQQPVVRCGEMQGCLNALHTSAQLWVVAEKMNSHASYYQTDCSGGQARRDVGGGIMIARGTFNCSSLGGASDVLTADPDH